MIKISVDEAYSFDYLSILEIKKSYNSDISKIYDIIKNDIIESIGLEKYLLVINSEDYKKLLTANMKTFEAVDKAKTDEVLASYVDSCNYQRMVEKNKIQEKFFSSKISEQKFGYEKLNKKYE